MPTFLAFLILMIAAPAAAQLPPDGLAMVGRLCAGGTSEGGAFPGDTLLHTNCDRRDLQPSSPRVWAAAALSDLDLTDESLVLTFDPVVFDAVEVRAAYADGTVLTRRYDSALSASHWLPISRTWLPVPRHAGSPLAMLAVAVDGPRSRDTFETLVLRERSTLLAAKMSRSIRFAALLMVMALPIFYNVVFFAVLRERFVLWHSVLLGSAFVYTASSTGMIYLALPQLPLWLRWVVSAGSFTIGVSAALMFARDFIEPGKMPPWQHRLLAAAPVMLIGVTALMLFGGPNGRAEIQTLYYASFAPVLVLCACVVVSALRRGSRSAKFLAASWTAIILAGIERILDGVGLYVGASESEAYIYYAVCFETFVTALGVADRFMHLRRERDREHSARVQLSTMVETDLLTGLRNRLCLQRDWATQGYTALAIVDLDGFKQVNDEYGHELGDRVLRTAAIAMSAADEERVHVYRWGGEEFVLGIHARSPEQAILLAQTARKAIEVRIAARIPELTRAVTASAGMTSAQGIDFDSAFRTADAALLQAKRSGRDRLSLTGGAAGPKHDHFQDAPPASLRK